MTAAGVHQPAFSPFGVQVKSCINEAREAREFWYYNKFHSVLHFFILQKDQPRSELTALPPPGSGTSNIFEMVGSKFNRIHPP